ncbi:MAG: hypothetical protein H6730_31415 [Deltaproteobacteria bacterium]|nr:hypothetical protein [Deltaproteobacteria bacterium]
MENILARLRSFPGSVLVTSAPGRDSSCAGGLDDYFDSRPWLANDPTYRGFVEVVREFQAGDDSGFYVWIAPIEDEGFLECEDEGYIGFCQCGDLVEEIHLFFALSFGANGEYRGVYRRVKLFDRVVMPWHFFCHGFDVWLERFAGAGGRLLSGDELADIHGMRSADTD